MSDDNNFVYTPKWSHKETKAAIIKKNLIAARNIPQVFNGLSDFIPTAQENEAYLALVDATGRDMTLPGEPLTTLSGACVSRAVALLAGLATGCTWKNITARTGITFLTADALKRLDKLGYAVLYKAAVAARDAMDRERLRNAVISRSIHGVAEPITGRIGKDQDGQLLDTEGNPMVKFHYSDRLAEFALSKLDKETFGEDKSNVNTGHQVIYNIQGLSLGIPGREAEMQQAEVVRVAMPAKAGTNPAPIEMPTFD